VPEKIPFLLSSCVPVSGKRCDELRQPACVAVCHSPERDVEPRPLPFTRDGMAGTAGLYFSSYLLCAPS